MKSILPIIVALSLAYGCSTAQKAVDTPADPANPAGPSQAEAVVSGVSGVVGTINPVLGGVIAAAGAAAIGAMRKNSGGSS